MIPGETKIPGLLSRVLARWDVSRFGIIPSSFSLIALPVFFVIMGCVDAIGGSASKVASAAVFGVWLAIVAFDLGRGLWSLTHPCASAHWLRAVRGAVGTDIAEAAFDHLEVCYGSDADYVIKRGDVATSVQRAKRRRRDADLRHRGVRLQDLRTH